MLLKHLGYLVALARERHFGRAAVGCGVTQPTLSAGIRRLELDLGVAIVRRGQRYGGLTAEGERVLTWAQRILADSDGLQNDLGALRAGLDGRLRVGAIPTSLASVSLVTTPFCERHPGVTVEVRSMSSREIGRGLMDFELDAGITYLDDEPLGGVRSVPLYRERYLLLTAVDEIRERSRIGWAEAAQLPLCLLTGDMQNRRIVDGLFASAGAHPRPVIETNSTTVLFGHARGGRVSAVMADSWLALFDIPPGLAAVPLVDPDESHRVGLVTLDRDPVPLVSQAIIATARTLALPEIPVRSGA